MASLPPEEDFLASTNPWGDTLAQTLLTMVFWKHCKHRMGSCLTLVAGSDSCHHQQLSPFPSSRYKTFSRYKVDELRHYLLDALTKKISTRQVLFCFFFFFVFIILDKGTSPKYWFGTICFTLPRVCLIASFVISSHLFCHFCKTAPHTALNIFYLVKV